MNIHKIVQEEVENFLSERHKAKTVESKDNGKISEIDLPNSLAYSPSPMLTKSGAQTTRTAYPKDGQIQDMIDSAGLTAISMNEEEPSGGRMVAYKGRGRSGSPELKKEPKFGRGLYFTPQVDVAKQYSDNVFKYELNPKKIYTTPRFGKIIDYQLWSFKTAKEFGDKSSWTEQLKSDGYDMIMGWNPAFKEWEYVVLDKGIIKKEEKVELVQEGSSKDIKVVNLFDFDGTLANTMEPNKGKKEYEKITGKKYPHIGWWDKPESLEPFDVELFPKLKNEFENRKGESNSKSFLLTNRVEDLSSQVKSILKKGGATMDGYDFYQSGKNKVDRIKAILKKFPKAKTINIYDDRADQLKLFKAFKKEMEPYFIDVNVFRCTNGKFSQTK